MPKNFSRYQQIKRFPDFDGVSLENNGSLNIDMSGAQLVSFLGKAGEQPGVFYETLIGNGDGLPGILTNGYISINPSAYPLGVNIAGEMTYMFGIATDIASNPMIVLKADTGKIIKAYGGDNTNILNVEHDGRLNISSSGQTEINLAPNADSWVSLAYDFGVGTNNPASKLHVEGTASNTVPVARFIGVNAGESVLMRLGLDAGGGSVSYWDFERDYATGDLQLNCNQTFANISCLAGASTGGFGIGTASPTAKLHVDGGARFDMGVAEQIKIYGVENYKTIINTADGGAAVITNGFVCIKGPQIAEPFDVTINGEGMYMLGIESDIGPTKPTLQILSGGPFLRGYNGPGNQAWFVENDGSQTIGQSDASFVRVGLVQPANHSVLIQAGNIRAYFNEEPNPRYTLDAYNAFLAFSMVGDYPSSSNGCKLGIPAAGSMAFYTSNFSTFVEAMRIDSSQRVGIGTDNPAQKLDVSGNARVVGDFYLKGLKFEESVDKPALLIGSYRDVRLGDTAGEGVYNLVAIGKNMFGTGVAGVDRITDSVALGTDCCTHMKHGNGNAAFGNLTLYEIVDSNSNTAIGDSALRNTVHTTGSTGWQNTGVGYICGQGNTTGMWNVFMGSYAASAGSGTANYTVLLGGYAGAQDDTVHAADSVGDYTIGIGYMAARYAKGVNLVAIGFESLIDGLGDNLTAVGHRAGAGVSDASASTSTFIGSQAGASGSQKIDCVNSTAIGYNAYTTRDNEVVLGNASVLHTVLHGDVTGIGMISLTQDYGGTAPSNGLWRGSGYTFLTVGASGLQINNTDNSLGLFNLLPTGQINMRPPASANPDFNGQMTFELTSNTSLTIKARGSDGTIRSTVLTLSP